MSFVIETPKITDEQFSNLERYYQYPHTLCYCPNALFAKHFKIPLSDALNWLARREAWGVKGMWAEQKETDAIKMRNELAVKDGEHYETKMKLWNAEGEVNVQDAEIKELKETVSLLSGMLARCGSSEVFETEENPEALRVQEELSELEAELQEEKAERLQLHMENEFLTYEKLVATEKIKKLKATLDRNRKKVKNQKVLILQTMIEKHNMETEYQKKFVKAREIADMKIDILNEILTKTEEKVEELKAYISKSDEEKVVREAELQKTRDLLEAKEEKEQYERNYRKLEAWSQKNEARRRTQEASEQQNAKLSSAEQRFTMNI